MAKKTLKDGKQDLWSAKDLLYLGCASCHRHICWRLSRPDGTLHASCCGAILTATPHFEGTRFHIGFEEADMTNVRPIQAGGFVVS